MRSRQRRRNACRAASSIGNSRPGSKRTSGTGYKPALRVRIERTNRVELIAEQIEPIGQRRAHRKQIDQSAANRKLARRDHLRHVLIAGEHQLRAQRLGVDRLALLEEERMAGDVLRGRQSIQRAGGRNDQHVDLGVRLAQADTASRDARTRDPDAATACRTAASPSRAADAPRAMDRSSGSRRPDAARRVRPRKSQRPAAAA